MGEPSFGKLITYYHKDKKMSSNSIRVRYAPSPTGLLHVGQIRTALFNYLYAKNKGGVFILRIEDTDKERSKKEYEDAIFEDLKWLSIEPDESPLHGGIHGPYRQSEQTEIYKISLDKLIQEKKAFWCDHKANESGNTVFWCEKDRASGGIPGNGIIRFKNPYYGYSGKALSFEDRVRGTSTVDPTILGDFSIARNLDSALYNFAVVVDDHHMNITHVIRGEDHLPNTPKQILLYEALGLDKPEYAHIPLVLATDRSKLSKRKGALAIGEYKKEGYLPEALLNFLALLGWNPGIERELFSKTELIQEFSLEKVQKSGAIFDQTKLDWMNGEYIRSTPLSELTKLVRPFLEKSGSLQFPISNSQFSKDEYIEKVVALERPRLKKLSEIRERIDYFFSQPEYLKDLLPWKKMSDAEVFNALEESEKVLSRYTTELAKEGIEKAFLEVVGSGDKGKLLWPLRVALSGRKASPGPFEIIEILGIRESLKRLQSAKELMRAPEL